MGMNLNQKILKQKILIKSIIKIIIIIIQILKVNIGIINTKTKKKIFIEALIILMIQLMLFKIDLIE